MSTTQTVKEVKNALITINNQVYPAKNLKIDKLGQTAPIQPLSGENPQHPTRFQLHANLVNTPDLSALINIELPKINITDTDTNTIHALSQAKIAYFSDGDLKITATHFR